MLNQSPVIVEKKHNDGPLHFKALDSIRGIAALSVVLFHISWVNIIESLNYVRNSYLMVDVFFVLSGFVVFYAYGTRIRSSIDVAHFMWLRFWRLYPLHFTFLFVFLLIECLKSYAEWHFGLIANNRAFSSNNLYSFMCNLFLLQALHFNNKLTYNGPAWSISVEFYTYIVFAVIAAVVGKRALVLVGAAVVSALSFGVLILLGSDAVERTFDFGSVRCLTGFFLGILTFALYDFLRSKAFIRNNLVIVNWLALLSLSGFAFFVAVKQHGFSDFAIYPLSAELILLVALVPTGTLTRFLCAAPFAWLGNVSYSVYMVHSSVLWGISQLIRFGTHAKEVVLPLHDTPVLEPSVAVGLGALVIALVLTLAISHFTYTYIEKPFRDWSKVAWRPKPRVLSGNAVFNDGRN